MTEERGVVKYEARDGQQVTLSFDTIKRYLVQGHSEMVTQQELMFFMGICKSKGLNPFNKDCYLIKYSQNEGAAIITAVDYFRKRAKAQRDCHGWQKGIILERDGKIVYSKGLMLEDDILLGGWFKAQPEGWSEPFELEVNLKGYIKKKRDGSVTKFWAKENQPTQIAKVAESQGLRTLWPDEFQQLYTPEEMGQSEVFSQAEAIITDKTTEEVLTDKIKPNYAAQDLKTKLDAGDKEVEGYKPINEEVQSTGGAQTKGHMDAVRSKSTGTQADVEEVRKEAISMNAAKELDSYLAGGREEEPEPSPIEQGESKGVLPDGVDPIAWLLTSRGKSSPTNAALVIRVFKAEKETIESQSDAIKARLRRKYKDAMDYLADIEAKKQAIAEEELPDDDKIPGFVRSNTEGYDANGRLEFISKMRKYMAKDHDKYRAVMNDNNLGGMNDVGVSDQEVILGFMAEAFAEE